MSIKHKECEHAMYLVCDTFAEAYEEIVRELARATTAQPRGMLTKEIAPVHLTLINPRSRLGYHSKRRFNLVFAVAESVLLFSPTNQVRHIQHFNKRMPEFSDNGVTFNAPYGYRIAKTLYHIINKLKEDRDTRQAVLPIIEATDLLMVTKDVPCTIALQFLLRDNKLDLHVYMRSNDFYYGFPYDLFNFTILQEVIANELGIEVGAYHHSATSMHVYQQHFAWLNDIPTMEPKTFSVPYTTAHMRALETLLMGLFEGNMTPDMEWVNALKPFGELLVCEYTSRQLTDDVPEWAAPFVTRWRR